MRTEGPRLLFRLNGGFACLAHDIFNNHRRAQVCLTRAIPFGRGGNRALALLEPLGNLLNGSARTGGDCRGVEGDESDAAITGWIRARALETDRPCDTRAAPRRPRPPRAAPPPRSLSGDRDQRLIRGTLTANHTAKHSLKLRAAEPLGAVARRPCPWHHCARNHGNVFEIKIGDSRPRAFGRNRTARDGKNRVETEAPWPGRPVMG